MGRMTATTVYLDKRQEKGLYRLAKAKGSHFSQEIRMAVDQHLAGFQHEPRINLDELGRLAREADQVVDRILRRLEDTSRRLDHVIRTVERSNRRALGGRGLQRAERSSSWRNG